MRKAMNYLKAMLYLTVGVATLGGLTVSLKMAWTAYPNIPTASAALSSAATIAIAGLTIVLAMETWLLRNQQNRQIQEAKIDSVKPLVSIDLEEGCVINDRNIVIKNVGKGIAYGLRFSIKPGGRAPEVEEEVMKRIESQGFLKNGIKFLGIGQSVESHVFLFHEFQNSGNIFETLFEITAEYSDAFGNSYSNKFVFDFKEYEQVNRLGGKPEREIADQAKKIANNLHQLNSQLRGRGIRVDTYTNRDRQDEKDKLKRHFTEESQEQ